MRLAFCYVSTTNLGKTQVKSLLEYVEKENNSKNITGLFLHAEGNFFQVIEGDKDLILYLKGKIMEDSRHFNVIKIFETESHLAPLDSYKCDYVRPTTKYDPKAINTYMFHLRMLDENAMIAVKNILHAFVNIK